MRSPQRLLPLLFLCGACLTSTSVRRTAPQRDRAPLTLPADWSSCSPPAFEAWLAPLAGDARPRSIAAADAERLSRALEHGGQSGVRAAVVLGNARSRAAAALLLARLEERVPHPERSGDAADVVAARALLHAENAPALAARLEALGAGPAPHPDLEVRVECAATALELGREGGVRFLLQVLRLGTPAGARDERDFTPTETSAWARSRASYALARHARIADPYRADAPLAAREAAVRELEAALGR